MSLIKYHPFTLNNQTFNTIADHLFNGSISDFIGSDFVHSQPAVNITETNDAFKLELAAPGLEKEDFDLNIEDKHLKISVKKEKEETKEDQKFTRREFAYTAFERSFKLSDKVDLAKISATYENGILQVNVPKKEEAVVVKRNIEIS